MAHYHWRELFPPHIWQRGQGYYREGHILNIHYQENCITAEIEGTAIYNVSVTLDAGTNRVEDFYCDCPYGEDGTPCKHLAALLCALEDTDDTLEKNKRNDLVLQAVESLSLDQMRQLLIQFAQNDSFVWEKLLLAATNQLPQSQKQQWQRDLQKITDEAADRYGFIDYEEAYDYCCSLAEYLYDRIPDLLGEGLVLDAFELVCAVFQTGMEQDMDDSDGGLTMLANSCMGDWNNILEKASTDIQKQMCRWFCGEYEKGELTQMFLDEYIFDAPWHEELAPELLRFLDKQIQMCLEKEQYNYHLNDYVTHRIYWMEQSGASSAERAAFIQKYHNLSAVRKVEIEQAKKDCNWTAAVTLLEESKAMDADRLGLVARYSEQLVEIYEILHDYASMRKELNYYLFTFRQDNLKFVNKLKAILPFADWEDMRNKLLSSQTMMYQVYPFLYQEGLYGQIMARIEAHADIHTLERYETLLKKEYPQRSVAVYEAYLHQAMDRASNRKAYWSVIQTLKKLKKYPDGKLKAQKLAEQWKQRYPRRTSMLDELKKAGF